MVAAAVAVFLACFIVVGGDAVAVIGGGGNDALTVYQVKLA